MTTLLSSELHTPKTVAPDREGNETIQLTLFPDLVPPGPVTAVQVLLSPECAPVPPVPHPGQLRLFPEE